MLYLEWSIRYTVNTLVVVAVAGQDVRSETAISGSTSSSLLGRCCGPIVSPRPQARNNFYLWPH